MTLYDLMERGLVRVRRMEWAYPHQYVELTVLDDGSYDGTGVLRTLADESALGEPSELVVRLSSLGPTDDRWEPYPRP